jgi:hypothetical protein
MRNVTANRNFGFMMAQIKCIPRGKTENRRPSNPRNLYCLAIKHLGFMYNGLSLFLLHL